MQSQQSSFLVIDGIDARARVSGAGATRIETRHHDPHPRHANGGNQAGTRVTNSHDEKQESRRTELSLSILDAFERITEVNSRYDECA